MFTEAEWFVTRETQYGKRTEFRGGKLAIWIVLGLIALTFILGSFGTVSAGERGVKTRFSAVIGVIDPGLYFKIPIIEKVNIMDIKTQTVLYEREDPLFSASKDLQDVKIATVVNYHLDPTQVDTIFQQYGSTRAYEANVIRPIVRDTGKSVASEFTAEELVTRRADYNARVTSVLIERLEPKSVIIERVNITNFEFSPSFTQAIEAKVTAVQNAEAAKNKLEQVKFEAQQTIETAKATAEAQRIQAQSLAAQGGRDYVALKAIEKWNGVLPVQMIPGSTVPFINLKN